MSNTILDKAIAAVPKSGNRIELFTKKLHLAQYADNSIYDYRLKIAQAVLFAENRGYPPAQNGDIRSLFMLFTLMAM